jgi:hypothetical protein
MVRVATGKREEGNEWAVFVAVVRVTWNRAVRTAQVNKAKIIACDALAESDISNFEI